MANYYKYIILFFFYSFHNVVSIAQTSDTLKNGFQQFFYANGKISSEGFVKTNKPDGFWRTYYENGSLKSEGNRINFLLDSIWKFYNQTSKLTMTINYFKGKKNGFKTVYDPDSNEVVSEEHYVGDVKQGFTFLYKNGNLYRQIPFLDGKENGLGKEFNKEGIVISLIYYKNGFIGREEKINRQDRLGKKQGLYKSFFEGSNQEKVVCYYSEDKLNGYLKEFDEKNNLLKTEKWIDGVLQMNVKELVKLDLRKDFYENGNVKSIGTFKQGVLEGVTRFYNDSGKVIDSKFFKKGDLISEGIYDERGLQQGPWKEYYQTGEIKAEGLYDNGKKIGIWKYFHQNGKQEQIGKYKKGKPDGNWKWYYESGNLLRSEFFDNGVPIDELIEYSDSGTVILKGSYLDGEPEGKWISIDNDVIEEGVYKNGVKYDNWITTYLSNNNICHKGNYIEGQENGKHISYYDNGQVSEQGEYTLGQRIGKWKHFDSQGNLVSVFEYKYGEDFKVDGLDIPFYNDSNNISKDFIIKKND